VTQAHLLVVDDNDHMREFVARVFSDLGDYRVTTASDGNEGLNQALADLPDLIVTDLAMPGLNGLEMIAALREAGRWVPAIIMTAEGSEQVAVDALRLGVADYFIKPFDAPDLIDAAERILNNWYGFGQVAITTAPIEADDQSADGGLPLVNLITNAVGRMQNPFFVVDEKGNVLLFNPAARSVFDKLNSNQDVTSGPLDSLTRNRSLVEIIVLGLRGRITSGEVQLFDDRTMYAHITRLEGVGCVVVMQDFTNFKAADRRKTELAEVVSHQVRSPLTAILSYIELLQRTGQLTPDQHEFARLVRHNVQLITETISDLLEIGKVEAGADQQYEVVSLEENARYALQVVRSKADAKGQTIHVQVGNDVPPVQGNPVRLRQVYLNLLENAIKYTPTGGAVTLTIIGEGGQTLSSISDTGIGIPLEDQPHIFDRFYRARNTPDAYEGTGLGLSIVKSIVEAHEGRIWVESKLGEGTIFTVVLPGYTGA
jgi:signal transduction histidine kinase/ActR/RegA family two-component response regulator